MFKTFLPDFSNFSLNFMFFVFRVWKCRKKNSANSLFFCPGGRKGPQIFSSSKFLWFCELRPHAEFHLDYRTPCYTRVNIPIIKHRCHHTFHLSTQLAGAAQTQTEGENNRDLGTVPKPCEDVICLIGSLILHY